MFRRSHVPICVAWVALGSLYASCGRPPGEANNFAGPERAGISSAVQVPTPMEQAADQLRGKLDELNQKVSAQEAKNQDLQTQMESVRSQIDSAQRTLAGTQAGGEAELDRKSFDYALQDIQVQRQQLELDVVRSELQGRIDRQKSEVAELGGLVQQEQAWGFDSPELRENSAKYAEAQRRLANLETQNWMIRRRAGEIAALHQQSQDWVESRDREVSIQNLQKQQDEQTKQIEKLTMQYDQLDQEYQKGLSEAGQLSADYKDTRDAYQTIQESLGRG